MKIYIIRHGETSANAAGVLQGWSDIPLNEAGFELARLTGEALKGVKFDAAISSPLSRARQTAETFLAASGNADVRIETDERIKEGNMGSWEGRRCRNDCEISEENLKTFFTDPFKLPGGGFPGGETMAQIRERSQEFLRELMARDDDRTYLVSTHGLLLRAMLNMFYEDKENFWHDHVPYNCVMNIIDAHGGAGSLTGDDVIFYDRSKCIDRYV